MQVMPDTGRWMRWYAGRPLRLRDTHDNIQAGVLTLRTLRTWTQKDVTAIAGVLPGAAARCGTAAGSTTPRSTCATCSAHERRLAHGQPPR